MSLLLPQVLKASVPYAMMFAQQPWGKSLRGFLWHCQLLGVILWQQWDPIWSILAIPLHVNEMSFMLQLGTLLGNCHRHQLLETCETIPFTVNLLFYQSDWKWSLHGWGLHDVDQEGQSKAFLTMHRLIEFQYCLFEALGNINMNIWKLALCPCWLSLLEQKFSFDTSCLGTSTLI